MRATNGGRFRFLRAAPLALAVALAGCALKTPPEQKALASEAMPALTAPAVWAAQGGGAGSVGGGWLQTFSDPRLDALVADALAYNASLRFAVANVERAAAIARQAGATLYPQVTAMVRGGGTTSDGSGLTGGGFYASWELDLWGRVRSQAAGGTAQFEAVEKDAAYARQSIAALVAKSWFLATEARRQRAIAHEMSAAGVKLATLARERQRIGRGDEYDVRVAEASAQGYRDMILQFDLAEQQAIRAIETLAGRYPAAALEVAAEFPAFPGPVPAGLPSELLERRLDVIAAERRVASAFYMVGEAEAARLPRIALTANVSSISSDLFLLAARDNPVWSLGAGITAPLFMGGALQAQVEIRTAEQKGAVANYGIVGSRAFAEVENALSAGFNLAERVKVLEAAVTENDRALELARVRVRVGTADQRGVEQQAIAAAAARAALTRARSERLMQRVNLHLALGGSFEIPQPAAAAPR